MELKIGQVAKVKDPGTYSLSAEWQGKPQYPAGTEIEIVVVGDGVVHGEFKSDVTDSAGKEHPAGSYAPFNPDTLEA